MPGPEKATEDLVFYKVLLKVNYHQENEFYVSPVFGVKAPIGELLSQPKQDEFEYDVRKNGVIEINGGGFHLFTTKEDAIEWMEYTGLMNMTKDFVVAKAVVPKGTLYVKGTFFHRDSVIAKNVMYTEILDLCA